MDRDDFLEGQILLFDKPLGWTSFDVVNKVRNVLKKTFQIKKIKVGHTGTLDPLATGLLVLCTGRFTKRIPELQGVEKTYTGTLVMGATTPSLDQETEIDQRFPLDGLTEDAVRDAVQQFQGIIWQTPPQFSAKKVEGKRGYKAARTGEQLDIPQQQVVIHRFDLTRIELPEVDFVVECSKGTYIRALARDLGKAVNNGAYLSALRRTHVGTYALADAMTIPEFIDSVGGEHTPPKPELNQ